MSKWKIYYTDESSLAYNDNRILEDVTKIPVALRLGVHSIIQPMDLERMRETIEQYHYLYLLSEQRWMGVGLDGLLDHLAINFVNIGCVLHGRTMSTDGFYLLRQVIRQDPDIIGGITAAEEESFRHEHLMMAGSLNRNLVLDANDPKLAYRYQDWSDMPRERPYPKTHTDEPYYGEQKYWQN